MAGPARFFTQRDREKLSLLCTRVCRLGGGGVLPLSLPCSHECSRGRHRSGPEAWGFPISFPGEEQSSPENIHVPLSSVTSPLGHAHASPRPLGPGQRGGCPLHTALRGCALGRGGGRAATQSVSSMTKFPWLVGEGRASAPDLNTEGSVSACSGQDPLDFPANPPPPLKDL